MQMNSSRYSGLKSPASLLALTLFALIFAVLYAVHIPEQHETSLIDTAPWGVANSEAPPTAASPPGSLGAYIYSPNIASIGCLIPGSSCTRSSTLATVVKRKGRHPPAVFIPVQDLQRLERLNKEDKQQLKYLKDQLQQLKDTDRQTVERTGEQLGALSRRVADLVADNVLVRKRVRVLRKKTGLPGKPGYAGVSGRPGVSDVVGPGEHFADSSQFVHCWSQFAGRQSHFVHC